MAQERNTDFGIIYDLTDTTALEDSSPSTTDNKSFADITLLSEETPFDNMITLEHNHSILDGTLAEFPDSPSDIVFFSRELSDENGEFSSNPTITVEFDEPHSSYALTLSFVDEHPLEVKVSWLNGTDTLYYDYFTITSNVFIVQKDIELYDKLIFEFTKALPSRYVKLYDIKYGVLLNWDETDVRRASMVNELNVVMDKLSINTVTVEIADAKDDTNFGNNLGMHRYFQRHQPMLPYEWYNDTQIYLGKYYLSKFSNENNSGKLIGQSTIGLLDEIQFNDGEVYNGELAGTVLASIFSAADIEDYEIDAVTANQELYGTLKPQTCRNALKEVLFACHSIIDTTAGTVVISKPNIEIASTIKRSEKFSTKATKTEYVSGVEIKYTEYEVQEEATEILSTQYSAGTYTVVFNTPYTNVVVTSDSLVDSDSNYYYATFTLSADDDVTITGTPYSTITKSVIAKVDYIDPGEKENIKTYTSQLCSEESALALANELLQYYIKYRLKLNIKYLASDIEINSMRQVENYTAEYNNYIAHYTKRNYDLSGGFIDNAELMGYFDSQDYLVYAGEGLVWSVGENSVEWDGTLI